MPKFPIDYSKTIIYKICCNDVNIKEVYVGHTTDLVRRRKCHKDCCNNEKSKEYNAYKYKYIRDNGGWSNWSLVPVEEYPCENVNQARIKERYWIETLQAELNKEIPLRTSKEWYVDNKEKVNEKHRNHYYNNIERYSEKHKQYREQNKEKINEIQKKYYENNKEKINEIIKCDCGGCYSKWHKNRHFKTKKHQEYLSTINENREERTP